MEELISANVHFLDQAERLLTELADQDYGRTVGSFYGSTVGQHLRHCLDHYTSLIGGLEKARVDYDQRMRQQKTESSTETALLELRRVRTSLLALREKDALVGLLVKIDCGGHDDEWQPSTLGRELQFLVSHTVHHFAMIGGMCTCLGVGLEHGFGVAPSTLKYRETASID